jgi:hypothetical protein
MRINVFAGLILLLAFSIAGFSQNSIKPLPSPLGMVTYKFENAYLKVTYGRPSMKKRVIFGKLVPFDKIWRTGANEATEISVSSPVIFGSDTLQCGTYTLFTIPGKEKWTVIVNSEPGQWGAFKYKENKDVFRTEIQSTLTDKIIEVFTIEFEQSGNNNKKLFLTLKWERTKVSIPIEIL